MELKKQLKKIEKKAIISITNFYRDADDEDKFLKPEEILAKYMELGWFEISPNLRKKLEKMAEKNHVILNFDLSDDEMEVYDMLNYEYTTQKIRFSLIFSAVGTAENINRFIEEVDRCFYLSLFIVRMVDFPSVLDERFLKPLI